MRQQYDQKQEETKMVEIQKERKSSEEKRMMDLEKRKDVIRENLKKMRQNHDKMVVTEH